MPTCFVIMPITTPAGVQEAYRDKDHFAHVLQHLFTPALAGLGYDVVPPSAAGSDVIQGEIIRNLDEADLVLCDMTTLNANVFFELGIRTALDKPVATVRDRQTEAIPFDHSIVNCHTYDGRMEPWTLGPEVERLQLHVEACVSRGGRTNTLWRTFGIQASARVGSTGATDDDKLDYLVSQVEELRLQASRSGGDERVDLLSLAPRFVPEPVPLWREYLEDVPPAGTTMPVLAEELGLPRDELTALCRRLAIYPERDTRRLSADDAARVRRTARREGLGVFAVEDVDSERPTGVGFRPRR